MAFGLNLSRSPSRSSMGRILALTGLLAAATWALAHSDADTKKDITRHRAMAAAHEAAAKCLEAGKKHDVCQAELQTACKGLALGKYCGMRHEH
jgi:hypothetical protein